MNYREYYVIIDYVTEIQTQKVSWDSVINIAVDQHQMCSAESLEWALEEYGRCDGQTIEGFEITVMPTGLAWLRSMMPR